MGSVFFSVLYGFWTWLLGFFLMAIYILGTHRILLVSFMWTLFGLSLLGFLWILFSFSFLFSFLSTQGTFDGDGHLSPFFDIAPPFFGSLTSPLGGKGLPSNILLYLWLLPVSDM